MTWIPLRKTGCDPASRSWLTSSGVASHRTAPSCEEPDRSTRLRGPKVRWSFDLSGLAVWNRSPSKPKPSDVPRPFLGRPLLRPALLLRHPKSFESRVALEEDQLFRRLFPAGPESEPEELFSLPAGGDRTFGHLPLPLAVAGSWGGRDRRPDHPCTMHLAPELGKRKMRRSSLWITGISGTTVGTFRDSPKSARFGCRSVPLRLPQPTCLNRLLPLSEPAYLPASTRRSARPC